MLLTDAKIKSMKPGDRAHDEKGLFILFPPKGREGRKLKRRWRFKYSFLGKAKTISLGQYPEVSLREARELRDEARKLLRDGIDPSANRKAQKAARVISNENTFEIIGREWHALKAPEWNENYAPSVLRRLETYVFPHLGFRPIAEITAPELLDAIRRIEARGTVESARRTFSYCGQIFRYAIATGRTTQDITYRMTEALRTPVVKHHPALTTPADVAKLLLDMDGFKGTAVVYNALQFSALVFQRPYEIRHARWVDIDLEQAEWRFNAAKGRGGETMPHIVPLAHQTISILEAMRPLTAHRSEYVFPNPRTSLRPLSENGVNQALVNLGYKDIMTAHGFRAMARTMLDEQLEQDVVHIEQQLAHTVKDLNGRAYNRTTHLAQRRKMMQLWANYLDDLRMRF